LHATTVSAEVAINTLLKKTLLKSSTSSCETLQSDDTRYCKMTPFFISVCDQSKHSLICMYLH
jgi:hypothetical protein